MPARFFLLILAAVPCLAQVEETTAPVYSAMAITARISGSVVVEVQVSERGAVTAATALEGDPLLRESSIDAARLWRFQPQGAAHQAKLIFSFRFMPKNTPYPELGTVFRPPYWVEVRRISPEPVSHVAQAGRLTNGTPQD